MQTYNAVVRLGCEVTNEVPRTGLTAPEIMVIRLIHGGEEAVVHIEQSKTIKVSVADELERLSLAYGHARVTEMFGNSPEKLPTKLAGFDHKKAPAKGKAKEELTDEELEELTAP